MKSLQGRGLVLVVYRQEALLYLDLPLYLVLQPPDILQILLVISLVSRAEECLLYHGDPTAHPAVRCGLGLGWNESCSRKSENRKLCWALSNTSLNLTLPELLHWGSVPGARCWYSSGRAPASARSAPAPGSSLATWRDSSRWDWSPPSRSGGSPRTTGASPAGTTPSRTASCWRRSRRLGSLCFSASQTSSSIQRLESRCSEDTPTLGAGHSSRGTQNLSWRLRLEKRKIGIFTPKIPNTQFIEFYSEAIKGRSALFLVGLFEDLSLWKPAPYLRLQVRGFHCAAPSVNKILPREETNPVDVGDTTEPSNGFQLQCDENISIYDTNLIRKYWGFKISPLPLSMVFWVSSSWSLILLRKSSWYSKISASLYSKRLLG